MTTGLQISPEFLIKMSGITRKEEDLVTSLSYFKPDSEGSVLSRASDPDCLDNSRVYSPPGKST
jgi:hypothetical protein